MLHMSKHHTFLIAERDSILMIFCILFNHSQVMDPALFPDIGYYF